MYDLQEILRNAITTGYRVLVELEKKDPELAKIQSLYEERSEVVDRLEALPDTNPVALEDMQSDAVKRLFKRLELLEKELNNKLFILSHYKQQAIKNLNNHRQAKDSYANVSEKHHQQNTKLVDLIDQG